MSIFRRIRLLLIAALLLILIQPASAHGYIVRAIPEDRAVLDRAPTRLQYWFSEDLEPGFSSLNVRDQNGQILATGGVDENDRSLMTVRLPSDLPDGAYIVELRPAFASDGHVIAESRVFFVGAAVGGVTGSASSKAAQPLEVVWRAILLSGVMLLFGAFTLYSGVLVPGWGSKNYPAGLLPPRVMHRLNRIVFAALILTVAANGLALIQQTMVFFGVNFGQAMNQSLWDVVRIGSRFGDVWNGRMILLGLIALLQLASIWLRKEYPETVRAFWTANAWLMALVVGASAATSHAAGSLLWPWVGVTIHWLHELGVAFWVGGLMALVLVLPVALQPYQGEDRRQALLAVMRRFSRLTVGAVLVVITTGIYNALNWLYAPGDLTQTTYGGALILKGLLVGLLLIVGGLHHAALRPQWATRFRTSQLIHKLVERAGAFTMTLRLEVVFALVVLVSVGLLSATPVPEPDFIDTEVKAPTQTLNAGDLSVMVTISPGGPGVNTFDTVVTRDGQPVDGLDIRQQIANPSLDWRSPWERLEAVDSGLYVTADDRIDRTGQWWTLLDITDENGKIRAAFNWTITNEAAVIDSRSPTLLNILALIGVGLAVGWVMFPSAQRYYHTLDLSPQAVTVAVGTAVIAVVLIVIGFVAVENVQRQYIETLYPTPEIVNTILPDADSLQRGHDLYTEYCIDWQSVSGDFATLRDGGHLNRDDELYAATVNGWRKLPPCSGDLTTEQRWDIVNYFRTLDRSEG